ncbi:MAG: hypothetical protein AUJ49_04350, partial [Desulfovibrionaceae bacterium CG1_02_65_16]
MRGAATLPAVLLALALLAGGGGTAGAASADSPPVGFDKQHNAGAANGTAPVHIHKADEARATASGSVEEKIGQHVPLDVVLRGEDGRFLRLGDIIDKPTIIAPVYYSCPNECNVLLGTLAQVLPEVGLVPGRDYQVLAVSFDEHDTPATATKRKGDFFNAMPRLKDGAFPPAAWRFLTGDAAEVRRLMDALGFSYARTPTGFRHSVALIALTPTGKISRYLYGIRPLAFDIAMAATEAGAEKTGLSVKRAIAMCYTYDPQGRRYVFDITKVAGAGVLFALPLFGVF